MYWLLLTIINLWLLGEASSSPYVYGRILFLSLPFSAAPMPSSSPTTIRVLALHGSGGNAERFYETVSHWNIILGRKKNIDLEIVTIDGPVEIGNDGGFSWWRMPPGVRSFQATTYDGFEESKRRVLNAINSSPTQFDVIMGHSQGGILLTSLLALDLIPAHPQRGYILNGVAWPNPYTKQLENLKFGTRCEAPRVLLIVGDSDRINSPEQALRVQRALQAAGCPVQSIHHPGGHSLPAKSDITLDQIMDWISDTRIESEKPKSSL